MVSEPYFSIIIPTRNRPELFEKAILSVITQDFVNKEIIVVNDGSDDSYICQYHYILENLEVKVSWNSLIQRDNGHGQSYSMNFGASIARGKYLCFLDDDDEWTDNGHLSRAYDDIASAQQEVDLYYSNQEAFYLDGTKKQTNVWIEDLIPKLKNKNSSASIVNTKFLLKSSGFAHLNCSIFRKEFYFIIGGMDENIRYECDRDIYIRSIDNAKVILYQPKIVSLHNIPDKKDTSNMSTLVNDFEKKLYQLRVYEKGILNSNNESVKHFCISGKMYQLKFLSESFYKSGKNKIALLYARQALAIRYTFKWHLFVLYLRFNSLTRKEA